jgi:N utilization substance protein B
VGSPKSARHRARILAVQALYLMEMGETGPAAVRTARRLSSDSSADGADSEELAYAEDLVAAVRRLRPEIDQRIAAAGTRWRVDRMAALDVQVLRVAVAELLARRSDVPPPVAIDEAVEIARAFGGEESPAFVNGVLDAVARSLNAPPDASAPDREER